MFCPMALSSMTLEHVSRSNQEIICCPGKTIPVSFWPQRRFVISECFTVIALSLAGALASVWRIETVFVSGLRCVRCLYPRDVSPCHVTERWQRPLPTCVSISTAEKWEKNSSANKLRDWQTRCWWVYFNIAILPTDAAFARIHALSPFYSAAFNWHPT